MNYSENYNFSLPSRDGEDIADINLISQNFETIDSALFNLLQNHTQTTIRLGQIETTINNNNTNLSGQIDSLSQRILTNATRIGQLNSRVQSLEEQITALQNIVDSL